MRNSLVIGTDPDALNALTAVLGERFRPDQVRSAAEFAERRLRKSYALAVVDCALLHAPLSTGTPDDTLFRRLRQAYPRCPVITYGRPDQMREVVLAMKAGAADYLTLPIDAAEVILRIDAIAESTQRETELDYLRQAAWQDDERDLIRSNSPAMATIFDRVRMVAPTRSSVLITGETGTGKGVLARLIHRQSHRHDRPFVVVHCGAIPDALIESELFGHEKGAFTGAVRQHLGRFEIANGGTIFLDELATIPLGTQVKLLQVLQEQTIRRVGGEDVLQVDVRVIAATNANLRDLSQQGGFRADLFYRLNVFPIEILALRERPEDLPLLVEFFISRFNGRLARDVRQLHPRVWDAFRRYNWPGNIRELENLLERACILSSGELLLPEHFPADLFALTGDEPLAVDGPMGMLADYRRQAGDAAELRYLRALLTMHRGRIDRTAAAAGIGVRQLRKLMERHGLRKEDFKGKR